MSANLCDQCAALCCRYFALPIDTPETRREYDDVRWYLMHENVVVFIESDQWYVGILNRCKNLQPDNRCGIYETRPKICREYTTDNCDYHGGEYDFEQLFTSAEQLRLYGEQKLKEARAKKRKKAAGRRAAAGARKPAGAASRRSRPKRGASNRSPFVMGWKTGGMNGKAEAGRRVSLPQVR